MLSIYKPSGDFIAVNPSHFIFKGESFVEIYAGGVRC